MWSCQCSGEEVLLVALLVSRNLLGAEESQEVHEEVTVEVLAELVKDKPVAEAAFVEVAFNLMRSLKIAVHPEVDQL